MGENNNKARETMFDCNGENAEMLKAKAMNRDYLHAIYGAELEPLNREVRYTRTAYLKELIDAEETCDTKTKKAHRQIVIAAVVFVVTQGFTVLFFILARTYREFMAIEKFSEHGTDEMVRAYWFSSAFFGSLFWIVLVLSILQLLFFLISSRNQIKSAKENYQRVVKTIEAKKQEQMLAGTYDATS